MCLIGHATIVAVTQAVYGKLARLSLPAHKKKEAGSRDYPWATKRSLDFEDLSQASSPCKSARVEGVLLQLSPMKGKYFDGRLADDKATIRLVGFDSAKQKELSEICEKQQPVSLNNCQVNKSKFNDEMEVVITSSTKIAGSDKKFNIRSTAGSTEITLDALGTSPNYSIVSVKARVIGKTDPMEVKPGLIKQNYTVADHNACAQLVLWQEDINRLKVGESYAFEKLVVKSFDGNKYLSPMKSGWNVNKCKDIEAIENCECNESKSVMKLNAFVAGVILEKKILCQSCKASCSLSGTGKIVKCTKCSMVQKADRCTQNLIAKLLINSEEDHDSTITLMAFLPVIQAIIEDDSLSDDADVDEVTTKLLEANNFDVTYHNGIIISIVRNNY